MKVNDQSSNLIFLWQQQLAFSSHQRWLLLHRVGRCLNRIRSSHGDTTIPCWPRSHIASSRSPLRSTPVPMSSSLSSTSHQMSGTLRWPLDDSTLFHSSL
ncbi:unnamed protein product [Musa hybrid cultivar]